MKRPPGIWFLLSVGVLWLSLENVCGLRATSLIFGRSPPTTTTTETSDSVASSPGPSASEGEIEASTEAVSNVTKPTLTGIPQIDYIWDPNLPKELNGYNLSEYPFYERVPEDIDFKCDGLHDGFYASVPHKCQVYHHCLFGTRYDFLCANYTAFDQKTFICHFVSEVDCLNSKKYWHRNDALYEAASTTTQKPLIVYTSPPKTSIEDSAEAPVSPRRPPPIHRRPLRRGRPHYDYYEYEDEFDDDYEERPRIEGRRRKKRPRPRPRPIYEDDYEEYEDDRYERRGGGRRRPQSTRRRNKDRRKYEDYDEDMEEDRRYHKRRPSDDFDSDEDRRRSRPKGSRRPVEDDYEDELPQNDRPLSSSSKESTGDKPVIKPASGSSIYDRPRTAPRIKPPVPKNEANKFAYKPINSRPTSTDDPEYYDDYEEEVVSVKKNHRKPEMSESKRHSTRLDEETDRRKSGSGSAVRNRQTSRDDYEEPPRRPHKNRPQYSHSRSRNNSNKRQPVVDEYYDDYIEDEATLEESKTKLERSREKSTTTTTPPPTTTTTTTREPPRERPESIVRVVKRPFLPSRGGNPLSARGLQPVGLKAPDKRPETKQETTEQPEPEIIDTIKPLFKPSPSVIKVPVRGKLASQTESETISNRPRSNLKQNNDNHRDFTGPRTTQKPKLATNQDPFDIVEDDEEYDVTLNDALNPTIPNLPVRSFPTGFSNTGYQQQRYVVNPILHPSTADYAYQQAKSNNRNQYADNKGQFSTITGQHFPSRVTQAYYTGYN